MVAALDPLNEIFTPQYRPPKLRQHMAPPTYDVPLGFMNTLPPDSPSRRRDRKGLLSLLLSPAEQKELKVADMQSRVDYANSRLARFQQEMLAL